MGDAAWKQWEREIARFFGAERNRLSGSSGRSDLTRSDTTHPDLYIEVKHGDISRFLNAEGRVAIQEAGKHAALEGKTPLIAIHPKGKWGFWILLHSRDFDAVARARGEREAAKEGEAGEGDADATS